MPNANPLKAEWWPLHAAWAWIATRDASVVARALSLTFKFSEWVDLVGAEAASAQDQLLSALRKGLVRARGSRLSGYPVVTAKEAEIGPGEWSTRPTYDAYSDDVLLVEFYVAGFGYAGVHVPVADVVAHWPANSVEEPEVNRGGMRKGQVTKTSRVVAAIDKLSREGRLIHGNVERAIAEELKGDPAVPEGVSPVTIKRALKKWREGS